MLHVLPVTAADGARADVICVLPDGAPRAMFYWLPAMGVAARNYLPLANALAARGFAVALHEWRGIGSSDRRAGWRQDWGWRALLERDVPAGIAVARAASASAPVVLGGHSLGGQLACLYAALHPTAICGIALVASGAPYWRQFRHGSWIGLGYALAPLVAAACGHLPGRRLGFAGNEARGVTRDWARAGRRGYYVVRGMPVDFPTRLAALTLPVFGLRFHDDWLGPAGSLDWLLRRMPAASRRREVLTRDDLGGVPADHFSWMREPAVVATRVADWLEAATRC